MLQGNEVKKGVYFVKMEAAKTSKSIKVIKN